MNLEELQAQQLNDDVATTAGNVDADYELPAHEDHLIHVRLVTRTNNPAAKDYDVTKNVQKLSVVDFEQMEKAGSLEQFDAVELLHDPRTPARQKADEKGELATTYVNQVGPAKVLRSTQDAQVRYKELFGEDAPADQPFSALKALIVGKEAETNGRALKDAQARYQKLYGEAAPDTRTLAELQEAITHKEQEIEDAKKALDDAKK